MIVSLTTSILLCWRHEVWGCYHQQVYKRFDKIMSFFMSSSFCWIFAWFTLVSNICTVVSRESEATPLATPFFKRAYKISHPPRLWVSWIDLPSFASSSKIWPNFSNKVFFSWSYEKVILTKNVRLTYYSSMKKKFRKIRMIFDIENSLWKSNFRTLRRAGKARQSIPERS